jgi:hypothetical protein
MLGVVEEALRANEVVTTLTIPGMSIYDIEEVEALSNSI